MSKTPVFDRSVQRLLGYLQYDEVPKSQQCMAVRVTPKPGSWPTLAEWVPRDVRHNRLDESHLLPTVEVVQFEFFEMRENEGSARVLLTDATRDVLERVRGFQFWDAAQAKVG